MAQSVGAVALDIVAGKNTLNNVVSDAVSDAQSTANKGAGGISNALGKIGGVFSREFLCSQVFHFQGIAPSCES